MTCPSPSLIRCTPTARLPAREAALLEQHAATCAACRARIEALRQESAVLRAGAACTPKTRRRFRASCRRRGRATSSCSCSSIALIGGFSKAFWSTVAAAIPSELEWLNPFESGALFERAVSVMTFIVYEGTAMWTATLNFVGAALVLAFVAWLAFSAVRHARVRGQSQQSLLAVVVALPSIGHAFEIRRSEAGS